MLTSDLRKGNSACAFILIASAHLCLARWNQDAVKGLERPLKKQIVKTATTAKQT